MPTQYKRHSVTETPDVAAALAPLREREAAVRLSELIVLGAREKLRLLDEADPAVERGRRRLAERVRAGRVGGDAGLADQVRRGGWSRG